MERFAENLSREDNLYLILDAARSKETFEFVQFFWKDAMSLYQGNAASEMAEFAPYILPLDGSERILKFLKCGWGRSWGIMFQALDTIDEVRKHFRRFVVVQMPNGSNAFFRFYDPRVLRDFLPACSAEEKRDFFGPVMYFAVESASDSECILFRQDNQMPQVIDLQLSKVGEHT
jgi:hypothetical protein